MNVPKILFQHLSAQSAVTAGLATYNYSGELTTPAIFTERTLPKDCKRPCLHIVQNGGNNDFGVRTRRGADVLCDVQIKADRDFNENTLRVLAGVVWKALHRADLRSLLDDEGWQGWGCWADPPQMTQDEDGFPMALITTRTRILESAEA